MPTTMTVRHKSTSFRPRHDRHQVVCVDDDADLTRCLASRLHRHKVDVLRAGNGRQGLRLVRSRRPSAIITDAAMPKGDGEYLIRRLKSRPSTARIPIIVISGMEDPSLERRIYRLGADRFLRKPVPFEDLFAELMSIMDPSGADTEDPVFKALQHGSGWMDSRGRTYRVDVAHETVSPDERLRVG